MRYLIMLYCLFQSGLAAASDIDKAFAFYRPHVVAGDINDKKVREELKVTQAQQATLDAMKGAREKIWQNHVKDVAKVKYDDKDKDAKLKALETDCSNKLFESVSRTLSANQVKRLKQIVLQGKGMMIFDESEFRDALKLTQKDADRIRAAYRKTEQEVAAQIKKQNLSEKEAVAKFGPLVNGVPQGIRDLLADEQRMALDDLLGLPFQR